ncbi:hypothetical protein [Niastella populi]|uniref:Uncharacterized protein n=1 Tax=Niastella populi TaxID=550983 RepID=A0A1V9G238_9BACT|nr:hypothetical protein [Niastella populi]OQP64627.1 hypothetical protein A4R26_16415 [Niastella populi]
MDISIEPIKTFLDAVDTVLNSNTFILRFDLNSNDINTELLNFIKSESFIQQLANQDKERGWYNMHDFDYKTESYKLRKGNIFKDKILLKIKEVENEKSEYLVSMLTGDTAKGPFFSFYSKQLEKEKSIELVDNLTSFLSVYSNWRLFIVEPDFLKNAVEVYSKEEDLRYFEGDYGADTATIILTKDKGYLLLTNGID